MVGNAVALLLGDIRIGQVLAIWFQGYCSSLLPPLFPSAAQIFTLFTTPHHTTPHHTNTTPGTLKYPLSLSSTISENTFTFSFRSHRSPDSRVAGLPLARPLCSKVKAREHPTHTFLPTLGTPLSPVSLSSFCTIFPVIPSTRFPPPSIASTSRFYWEFLVYIIDQIKQKERNKNQKSFS